MKLPSIKHAIYALIRLYNRLFHQGQVYRLQWSNKAYYWHLACAWHSTIRNVNHLSLQELWRDHRQFQLVSLSKVPSSARCAYPYCLHKELLRGGVIPEK